MTKDVTLLSKEVNVVICRGEACLERAGFGLGALQPGCSAGERG